MVNQQESKVSEYLLIESLWNLTMKQICQLSPIKRVGYLSIGIGIWEKSMSFRLQSTHTSI